MPRVRNGTEPWRLRMAHLACATCEPNYPDPAHLVVDGWRLVAAIGGRNESRIVWVDGLGWAFCRCGARRLADDLLRREERFRTDTGT